MFKAGKEYKTVNGIKVRIYATDCAHGNIHGALLLPEGWISQHWNKEGITPYVKHSLVPPRKPAKISIAVMNAMDAARGAYGGGTRKVAEAIIEAWRDEGCPEEE